MTLTSDIARSELDDIEQAICRSAGPRLKPVQACALVAANALEFFDFFMYATFSAYIGHAFFPANAAINGTFLSLAIFAVGYLSRPVGGAIVGRYADTRGRKPAMLLTGSLITLGAVGIAITPSYETIGALSSLLILTFRMLQGFAIGGEMGASSALLLERTPESQSGRYGGYQVAGQGLAIMAAGACALSLVVMLPPPWLAHWGWRLPFVLGAILVPIQLFLRRSIPESNTNAARAVVDKPRAGDDRVPLLLSVLLIFGGTVPTYVIIYVTSLGIASPAESSSASFIMTCVTGAVTLAASLAGGVLADIAGINAIVIASRVATAFAVYPAFAVATASHSQTVSTLMIALIAGLSALGAGPTITLILTKFPRDRRATGLSLAYAIGVAFFGGTAPLVAATLVHWSGNPLASAWYVMTAACCAVIAQRLLMRWPSYPLRR